ncbi:MAG: deoxyribodipyrimidine photo-lyase [Azospirillaceae bacterium]
MTDSSRAIVWFRHDLRLSDNPALAHAARHHDQVLALYCLDEESAGAWTPGGASRWWLHHSLAALAATLDEKGVPLVLRRGPAERVVPELAEQEAVAAVYWNRRYYAWGVAADKAIKRMLGETGITAESFNGTLLREPWETRTGHGAPYRVYTPFWRAYQAAGTPAEPQRRPARVTGLVRPPASDRLADWGLLPTGPDWAGGLRAAWTPGEDAARRRLHAFLDDRIGTYARDRNRPDIDATSFLSPHLHFGEIGPRQIWHAVLAHEQAHGGRSKGSETFLKELVWREFSHNLLFYFPGIFEAPIDRRFEDFPWRQDADALKAWQRGRTGYPVVDAGMRQLWETGWMHNRVRMVVASFLVKHLLLPWQRGEAWFWDTLVDADHANNASSWQWVAGCGADAAPFFRIFNPMTQGEKFDPDGAYVRKWVPELKELPTKWIHAPWTATPQTLEEAGIRLGETYPHPIVDHAAARARALDAFDRIKRGASG